MLTSAAHILKLEQNYHFKTLKKTQIIKTWDLFYICIINDLKAEIHSIVIYFTRYTYKNSVSLTNSLSLIKINHAADVDFNLKLQLLSILCPNFSSLQRHGTLIKTYINYFLNVFLINPYCTHHKSEKTFETLLVFWMHVFCFNFKSFKTLLITQFHVTYDQFL